MDPSRDNPEKGIADLPFKKIKQFTIVGSLGRGGMGEVYKAYDEKLKRNVAIKALRQDQRLTPDCKARFIREAEILSSLEHPNICRIYEFIEEDDCDFLVLEHIEGRNLLQAKRAGMSDAEKLRMMAAIASGLAVAHENQVVHRDLKPENIMITARGSVKILDFGLAHSLRRPDSRAESRRTDPLTDERTDRVSDATRVATTPSDGSFQTEYGLVMGTPHFLSPEQARGETTTAASDMYSFGLLLHWLFSSSPLYPQTLDTEGVHIKAIIGETLPPRDVPTDLLRLIQRLKSMAPELRPTAVETQAKIEWIRNKPKRRVKRLASLAVMAALGIGIVISTLSAVQLKRANTQTQAVNAFLKKMLTSPQPTNQGIDVKVVDLLDFASQSAETDFGDLPETKGSVLHTLGQVYTALGDFEKAGHHLEQALEVRRRVLGAAHVDTLDSMTELTVALYYQGKLIPAESLARESLDLIKSALGEDHPFYLIQMNNLGATYFRQSEAVKAEATFRETLELERRLLGPDHPDTLSCMNNLAAFLCQDHRVAEAEPMFREVVAVLNQKLGPDHPNTLKSKGNLAKNLLDQGKMHEALAEYRAVLEKQTSLLGPDHSNTLQTEFNVSVVLCELGRYQEAETVERASLEKRIRVMGPDHPGTIRTIFSLAQTLQKQDRHRDAEPLLEEVYAKRVSLLGETHETTLRTLVHQIKTLLALGKLDTAQTKLDTFFSVSDAVLEAAPSISLDALKLQRELFIVQGKHEEAERMSREIANRGSR